MRQHAPRPRPRRRRRSGNDISPGAQAGAPRFLGNSAAQSQKAEHEARQVGREGGRATARPEESILGQAAATAMSAEPSGGDPLDTGARAQAETAQDADFGDVRIHANSGLAAAFGANAVTYSGDIHFAPGAYRPGTAEGDTLIGHELAHVVQQRVHPSIHSAQFDIQGSYPVSLGGFQIDMTEATSAAGGHGERGTVEFIPLDTAPYTARLGLVQAISLAVAEGTPIDPEDHIGPPSRHVSDTTPADIDALSTEEAGDVEGGWRIDARTTGNTTGLDIHDNVGGGDAVREGRGRDPFYQDSWNTTGSTQYGWVRGPGDVRSTMLWDHPQTGGDRDFDFETAAVGADNAMVYGVLKWGFEVQNGEVHRPYARAEDAQSATFDAAMERFRGHYAHEPIVVYFGTNLDAPTGPERAKVDMAAAYLNANPNMEVTLEGYADRRGTERYNADLAARRRVAVQTLLEGAGIDSGRIWMGGGDQETTEFGDEGALKNTPGNLQANRRVVMSFDRASP